jgi:hypothetical protein
MLIRAIFWWNMQPMDKPRGRGRKQIDWQKVYTHRHTHTRPHIHKDHRLNQVARFSGWETQPAARREVSFRLQWREHLSVFNCVCMCVCVRSHVCFHCVFCPFNPESESQTGNRQHCVSSHKIQYRNKEWQMTGIFFACFSLSSVSGGGVLCVCFRVCACVHVYVRVEKFNWVRGSCFNPGLETISLSVYIPLDSEAPQRFNPVIHTHTHGMCECVCVCVSWGTEFLCPFVTFAVDSTMSEIYVQWGKKVFSQPPIVQVLPLKMMRGL